MKDAWSVVRAALAHTWHDLITTALVNLAWLLLCLPVVTAPPATLALFYTANRMARGEVTDAGDFFRALPRYFWPAWRWGLLNLAMLALLVGDILLSGRLGAGSGGARLVQGLYLAGLAFWLLLQLYVLAFFFEQEEPSLRLALRNGALMLGTNPVFSTSLLLLVLLALLLGSLLFFVSLAAGGLFVALVANHAVLNRLEAHRMAEQGEGT
ncbi:MAG TPA: YesL family protein [Anaerolineae bacterium]|nr:YesL family protein [Anaerolineae bacterium]